MESKEIPEKKEWDPSMPHTPFGETHVSVFVPGEAAGPPGMEHDEAWEMAYEKGTDEAKNMAATLLKGTSL
jgi:hypothetical protein